MARSRRNLASRLIVCLTGMPGAGKSTVATFLKEKGFVMVTMGDAVREEARRQGIEPSDANLGKLMLRLREKMGPGAVAHLVLEKISRDSTRGNIVIDGIRSNAEVEVLRTMGEVKVLAVHASQDVRYRHVKERARSDAPSDAGEFAGRDKRELSVGISDAIALADETISNNDLTLDQLKSAAGAIVEGWLAQAAAVSGQ